MTKSKSPTNREKGSGTEVPIDWIEVILEALIPGPAPIMGAVVVGLACWYFFGLVLGVVGLVVGYFLGALLMGVLHGLLDG